MLSIISAEMISDSGALDAYKMTVVLNNRLSIPVTVAVIGTVKITSVRASGAEMGSGFVHIADTYEIQPGERVIFPDSPTTYHGFGSPVVAFKLSGDVYVRNSYPDQLGRVKFCSYRNVEMGAPLQGQWGS